MQFNSIIITNLIEFLVDLPVFVENSKLGDDSSLHATVLHGRGLHCCPRCREGVAGTLGVVVCSGGDKGGGGRERE